MNDQLHRDVVRMARQLADLERECHRFKRERDEARRMACEMEERIGCDESGCPKNGLARDHAKRRGWDCFKEAQP